VRGKPVWFGKRCVMQVITGSMEPTLHVGECIVMEKISPDELREGDIIAYISEAEDIRGKMVTHRIYAVLDDGTFDMRGDANPVSDRLHVRKDQVVGRYLEKSGFFTWMMSFADLRKVGLLVIMLVVSAMAVYEVRTVVLLGKEARTEQIEDTREQLMREAIDREIARLKAEHEANGTLPEPIPQKEPPKPVPQKKTKKPEPQKAAPKAQKTEAQKSSAQKHPQKKKHPAKRKKHSGGTPRKKRKSNNPYKGKGR
jgi:signal peptidase I